METEHGATLLGRMEEDILSLRKRYPRGRSAALHAPTRKALIKRPDLIPAIDERISILSRSTAENSARSIEGLLAIKEWILIHCGIPNEQPDPISIGERFTRCSASPKAIAKADAKDAEEFFFAGTRARAIEIYRQFAKSGISEKEDFIVRRYLGLHIPAGLERFATMECSEYFNYVEDIMVRLPSDAR